MEINPTSGNNVKTRNYLPFSPHEVRKKLDRYAPGKDVSSSRSLPSFFYTDPEIYEVERFAVQNNWLAVGSMQDLNELRSYITERVFDEPITIWKTSDDTLKSFSNVCRHRAATLLHSEKGKLEENSIKCIYHGWKYGLDGALKKAPHLGRQENFLPCEHGLVPFEVDTWGPLVFLRMKKGASSLLDTLKPLPEMVDSKKLSTLKWKARKKYLVDCNWKAYIDNYLDGGYHVGTVHKDLSTSLDLKNYRTEVFERCSLQHTPTKASDEKIIGERTGEAQYWWVFPNAMVNIYDGVMDTNIVLPRKIDQCEVIFDFYFSDDKDEDYIKRYIEGVDSIGGSHQVQVEDEMVCKWVQEGLNSNFYFDGPYAKPESGQFHFHKLYHSEMQRRVERL